MFAKALIVVLSVQLVVARPQFITFKDGKFGVNFGGYHAEAGLGGLLTGNAAHGGLSASAGTPFGQRAGAGLGGSVDGVGRTAGGLYAGATAGNGIGASSSLGGGLDGQNGGAGGLQAESHAYGVSKSVVKLADLPAAAAAPAAPVDVVAVQPQQPGVLAAQPNLDVRSGNEIVITKTISKKKYVPEVVKTPVVVQEQPAVVHTQTTVQQSAPSGGAVAYQPFDYRKFFDFSFFANTASSFGGSPFGFGGVQQQHQQNQQQQQVYHQPAAPQTVRQDPLISYTVQKQFAPVQFNPLELDTRINIEHQPPQQQTQVVQAQTQVQAVHDQVQVQAQPQPLGGAVQTNFHKTVYVSPLASLHAKKALLRRLHPKRVHVVKTIQIQ